jgi:quinol monooxygenase YgiN
MRENALIKHIVMWNLRGGTPEEKCAGIAQLQRSFESLRGRIPGLLHFEIGVDSSRIDYACDVVLYSEFESQAALDGYAVHPEHQRVKRELADLRTARHQVDYASPPALVGAADHNLMNGDLNER